MKTSQKPAYSLHRCSCPPAKDRTKNRIQRRDLPAVWDAPTQTRNGMSS